MNEQKKQSLTYIPELDGLRAIACLAVMFFHLHIPGFSLGWSGVYLFFVLSGFLITRILINSKNQPDFLKKFYLRRFLRILPIYYIMVIIVSIFAIFHKQNIRDLPLYLLYLQNNILAWKQWSVNFPGFMNHTWSLAIESQFYLVYPLLVFWLKEKYLLILSIIVVFLSFALRVILFRIFPHNPNLLFAISPTAIDSLTIGCILALIINSKYTTGELPNNQKLSKLSLYILLLTFLTLVIIVIKTGINNYWNPYLWGRTTINLPTITVMSVFFASLIAYILSNKNIINDLLKLPIINHLGKISYGLYLYHFPVFAFFQHFKDKYISNIYIYMDKYNVNLYDSFNFLANHRKTYQFT